MNSSDRTAGCACGHLTAVVTGEPDLVAICACKQCQLRTGSVYSAHAFFAEQNVNVNGTYATFTRKGDSGKDVSFHRCVNCGSTVFWLAEKRAGQLGIALGALSAPEVPKPIAALYTESIRTWVTLPEGVPTFDQGVPGK
jgi:hypothetical protein